jgi:hypothetical protein
VQVRVPQFGGGGDSSVIVTLHRFHLSPDVLLHGSGEDYAVRFHGVDDALIRQFFIDL